LKRLPDWVAVLFSDTEALLFYDAYINCFERLLESLMNKKLYVGNLNYAVTDDELRKLFLEIGPVVSATVITDKATGRSKGFGFVEMETEQAAMAAIEELNNREVRERAISVSEARPPRERSFGGDGGRRNDRRGGNRGQQRSKRPYGDRDRRDRDY
jgi:RNA recognition motif-containing protein